MIQWLSIGAGMLVAWLLVAWLERRRWRGAGVSAEALVERLEEEDRWG